MPLKTNDNKSSQQQISSPMGTAFGSAHSYGDVSISKQAETVLGCSSLVSMLKNRNSYSQSEISDVDTVNDVNVSTGEDVIER